MYVHAFWRAASALWWRDVRKLARFKSRVVSGLAQPLMYMVALGTGLSPMFKAAGFGSYVAFLAPGVIAMTLMTSAFVGGLAVLWDREFGFMKEALIAPVPRVAIMLGKALGAASVASVQAAIVLALAIAVGDGLDGVGTFLCTIAAIFYVGLFFALAGIFCGVIVEDTHSVQLLVNFLLMPLFMLSGALYPLSSLEGNSILGPLVAMNPVAYCVDLIRAAMSGKSHFAPLLDLSILTGLTLALLLAGERRFARIVVS